ncbi:MAG: RnfABCDGE type electron transport complex subunit B [Saccharofermentanales bacterium]
MISYFFSLSTSSSPLQSIMLPTLILGGTALLLGVIMAVVSKVFALKQDPLKEDIQAVLPQANCGACGFAGCEGYAVYLAGGGTDTGKCPVGGSEVSAALAEILGVSVQTLEARAAHVICKGNINCTSERFVYRGIRTCASANALFLGHLSCTYGCLGFGDCVQVCPFDAIDIRDGIAVINEFRCKACEKCVAACPKKIIAMIPKDGNNYKVDCSNHQTGGDTRKHCKVGCIACQRCYKACPSSAITMVDNLAVIDPYKCTSCNKCYEVCPTRSISNADEIYAHL